MVNGWINLNKPEGVTSAYVLNRLKRAFPKKTRIGHAGTLDKVACGVLPVAVGAATKTIPMIMDADKTYTFTVRWGVQTDTDDRDGQVVATSIIIPARQDIEAAMKSFRGAILQTPPVFSALKVDGMRASDRVRRGETVELQPRHITIIDFQIVDHTDIETMFTVTCSKGTYVRALAKDLAAALNTLGYVTFLRRDRVGKFQLKDSILLEKELQMDDNAKVVIGSSIIPIRVVLDDIPAIPCTELAMLRISKGQSIPVSMPDADVAFAVDEQDVIATGYIKDRIFYPKNVFMNGV
jgi:tRNA pseudouridine55 synthase